MDYNKEKQNSGNFPPKKRKTEVIGSGMLIKGKNERRNVNIKISKAINNKSESLNGNDISVINKKGIIIETKDYMIEEIDKKDNSNKRKSKEIKIYKDINSHKLDDLDLNNLPYEKALDLDKRTFSEIYWSKLKSKHLIIYTFFSYNVHNILYILKLQDSFF